MRMYDFSCSPDYARVARSLPDSPGLVYYTDLDGETLLSALPDNVDTETVYVLFEFKSENVRLLERTVSQN